MPIWEKCRADDLLPLAQEDQWASRDVERAVNSYHYQGGEGGGDVDAGIRKLLFQWPYVFGRFEEPLKKANSFWAAERIRPEIGAVDYLSEQKLEAIESGFGFIAFGILGFGSPIPDADMAPARQWLGKHKKQAVPQRSYS